MKVSNSSSRLPQRRIQLSRWRYYFSSIPTLLLGIRNWRTMVQIMLGFAAPRLALIELKNGLRFHVRTRLDIWILKETTLDQQYERASVAIQDGWRIIDIGAGLGDFAISVAKAHPHSTVYAYEPFPDSFQLLNENLRLNQTKNVKAFPYAVGATSGSLQLHAVSVEAVQQTTIAGTSTQGPSAIQVQSISLDQVFVDLGLSNCDYVKMDCEGAEYGILFNAGPGTLEKIKHICLEYHDDVTPYTHNDLSAFLEKGGFRVHVTPNPAHWQWGLLYAENQVDG